MGDFHDIIKLFGVLVAILIPVTVGWAMFTRIMRYKQSRLPAGGLSPEVIEDLRSQMLEREDRVRELEERVDFVERMLTALKEGRTAEALPQPRKEKTPV